MCDGKAEEYNKCRLIISYYIRRRDSRHLKTVEWSFFRIPFSQFKKNTFDLIFIFSILLTSIDQNIGGKMNSCYIGITTFPTPIWKFPIKEHSFKEWSSLWFLDYFVNFEEPLSSDKEHAHVQKAQGSNTWYAQFKRSSKMMGKTSLCSWS